MPLDHDNWRSSVMAEPTMSSGDGHALCEVFRPANLIQASLS